MAIYNVMKAEDEEETAAVPKEPLTDGHDFFDAAVLFLDEQWRAVVPSKALWLRRDRQRERKRYNTGTNTLRFIT